MGLVLSSAGINIWLLDKEILIEIYLLCAKCFGAVLPATLGFCNEFHRHASFYFSIPFSSFRNSTNSSFH